MPLPSANPWGFAPVYGVINEGDDTEDATQDSEHVPGSRINQMSSDIIELYAAENARRAYATVKTAAETLDATAHDKLFTNTGAINAASMRALTLPSDEGCKRVSFYNDGPGLRVLANSGQTIRVGAGPANVTKTAGYIESSIEGSFITLIRLNANKWVAMQTTDWEVEVS